MAGINRQWLLKRRPDGMVLEEDFEYIESAIPEPNLNHGEILVRNLYLSFDPAMRGWMDDEPSYLPPVELNEPMRASAVSQVIRSENSEFPEGSFVQGFFGWQDYALAGPDSLIPPMPLPEGTPLTMPLSIFGGTSLTAYFGLLDVGKPEENDMVVVSGAAGATGSVVCQIAKIKGCRVIGIAGGKEKCDWLLSECGVDNVVDYKNNTVSTRLGELCPDGINVFYDNVGGDILEAAIDHIAERGRIVLCGQISTYNDADPKPGPQNLKNIITRRVRMEGFIMIDYIDRIEEAMNDLVTWVMDGKIKYREDIQEGFENIPRTFLRLFEGKNQGKQLLKISDPAA
ncbi:MAG: NADP-dependent oxidoreductase [Deltaproteobacteria bacterium]|nr:NADP-dependent oxidoreductase [Deltaproteobacteria bacterium]